MDDKDYYKILGVTQNMTRKEIQKVFWKLAHIYHPDKGVVPNDAKFKEINEAWSVFDDKDKRAAYDINYRSGNPSSSVSGGVRDAAPASAGATQRSSQPRYRTRKKDYTTSHSTPNSVPNNSNSGTTPGASPSSSPSSSGPKRSSNPLLALWYQFTYYTGQILSFLGQAAVGVFVFFIFYGIVAPIIDLVLWIFGNRHWLTETFIGLFFFSGMLAIALFVVSEAMGSPKYRKVSYVMGIVSLVVFLVGEGIPAAYSHRFRDGDVATTQEIKQVITPNVVDSSTIVNNASYLQNKQNFTYSEVKALQTALAKDKSVYPEGYVTGTYGQLTHNALIRFQKKYGLSTKGYYGPQTRAKVQEVFGILITSQNTLSPIIIAQAKNATEQTEQVEVVEKPRLRLRFVTQHGISYETAPNIYYGSSKVFLADILDEKIQGRFEWNVEKELYEFDRELAEKQYKVVWNEGSSEMRIERGNTSPILRRGHGSGSQSIIYKHDLKEYVVTVPQISASLEQDLFITFVLVNEVDTPLSISRSSVIDKEGKSAGWIQKYDDTRYSFSWSKLLTPGNYTVTVSAKGYQPKDIVIPISDFSNKTNEQIIGLPNIDLGKIVLEKE